MPRNFQLGKRHKYDWQKNAKLTVEHVPLPPAPINKESLEAPIVSIPLAVNSRKIYLDADLSTRILPHILKHHIQYLTSWLLWGSRHFVDCD